MIQNLTIRHGLQSDEWMLFQKSLGKRVVSGHGNGWSVSAVVEGSDSKLASNMKRLYAPYGPHVTSLESMKEAIAFLKETAKTEKASYIRIEPTQYFAPDELKALGCKKVPHDFQPSLTHVVDLTKPVDELISAMDYEMRRLNRQLDARGFSFEVSYDLTDISDFLDMMRLTSKRANAVFRESSYLKSLLETLGPSRNIGVAYAINSGKKVSGVLFFDDNAGKTRYYMYAGSSDEARKLNGNAAVLLHLFFKAKESGLERFDFFGVSPIQDKNHRWAGFSKFKRDFGGVDVQYSGTWEVPVNKAQYTLMSSARKLNRH